MNDDKTKRFQKQYKSLQYQPYRIAKKIYDALDEAFEK